MSKYILAHDLGTSGNKATLFNTDGTLEGSCVSSYQTLNPKPGWAEQNPEDWWKAVVASTQKLMVGKNAADVIGISFSGQMMGCVCIDKYGQPLRNSIIWADTRAQEENQFLLDELGMRRVCQKIGQRLAPNFTLQKLMWLKKNEPEVYKNTTTVFQAKDYIVYRMTGKIVTEHTDAAYTQAYDIENREWSTELISTAGIRKDIFPQIVKSSDVVGKLTTSAARELGLSEGTPIIAGAGDGSCATVGAGSISVGDGYCCLGSSSWLSNNTKQFKPDPDGRVQYSPHVIDGLYMLAGTMQTGGLAYNWARKKLYTPDDGYDVINSQMEEVPPGANGVTFLPYLMGERAPWWNAQAKGIYAGLNMTTTKADMMKAVVEGVVMNLSLISRYIQEIERINEMTVIGGGAKGNIWRQTLADVLGMEIGMPKEVEESSSLGAAMIAGVGLGVYSDYSIVKDLIQVKTSNQPNEKNYEIYKNKRELFESLYLNLEPMFSIMI